MEETHSHSHTHSHHKEKKYGSYPYVPLEDEGNESIKFVILNSNSKIPKIVFLSIIFYVFATCMPLYNNLVFEGYHHNSTSHVHNINIKSYPYPLTSTWLQLLGVSIVLLLYSLVRHYLSRNDLVTKSWVFGPNFFFKLKHLFLVSVFFGLVMTLTNMGLYLINNVNVHVLLRASEVIWVVLFALVIQREIPTIYTVVCVILLVAGTVLVSLEFSHKNLKASAVPLVINLSSSIASGIMIVLLRRAVLVLRKKDLTISIMEITLFKMVISTILLLPFALWLEYKGFPILTHDEFWTKFLVSLGVMITMLYQVSVVGLTTYMLATSVGMLSQAKIIPQIILSIIWQRDFSPSALHITGTVLLVVGSIGYAIARYIVNRMSNSATATQTKSSNINLKKETHLESNSNFSSKK